MARRATGGGIAIACAAGIGLFAIGLTTAIADPWRAAAAGAADTSTATPSPTETARPSATPSPSETVITAATVSPTETAAAPTVTSTPYQRLGGWRRTTDLATPRSRTGLAVANGHLYAVGGLGATGALTSVERAPIGADGSLGPWQPAPSLTVGRVDPSVSARSGYLFAVGRGSTLERAALNPDGSLGAWQALTPVTGTISLLAGVATEGGLLAVGNATEPVWGNSERIDLRAPINADGTIGAWQTLATSPPPPWGYQASAATAGIFLYGGRTYHAWTVDTIGRLTLRPDGSATSMQGLGLLPDPGRDATYHFAEAAGSLYAIDDRPRTATGDVRVRRAPFRADGILGGWSDQAPLGSPRTGVAAIGAGDVLYAVGGVDGATILATVDLAPVVRHAAFLPLTSREAGGGW